MLNFKYESKPVFLPTEIRLLNSLFLPEVSELENHVDDDLWEAPAVHLPAEQKGHGDKESVVAWGQGQEAAGVGEHGARGQLTAHSAARAAQGAHCSQA